MSKIWLTSDHHFGHKNVIRYCNRPFSCVEEMDDTLLHNHNSLVGKRDTVYHLGDVSLSKPEILKKMNGQFYLIRGNHDKWARKSRVFDEFLNLVWVGDYREVRLEGRKIVLCHYPFQTWNAGHYGSLHFHGHSHGEMPSPRMRRVDVGVDCWDYGPLELTVEFMEELEQNNPVIKHHNRVV